MKSKKRKIPTANKSPFNWWIAYYVIRFEFQNEDRSNLRRHCLEWKNTVILKAIGRDQAYEKALKIGRRSTVETNWCVAGKGKGKWVFVGIAELLPIYERIEDKAEIYFAEYKSLSVQGVKRLVSKKRDLEAFDNSLLKKSDLVTRDPKSNVRNLMWPNSARIRYLEQSRRKRKVAIRSQSGWWIARYLIRFEFYDEDRSNLRRRCLAWDNTILLTAGNREAAYKKVVREGKAEGLEGSDLSGKRKGRWKFEGLTSLAPVDDGIIDGAEIFWTWYFPTTVGRAKRDVLRKRDLDVFNDKN